MSTKKVDSNVKVFYTLLSMLTQFEIDKRLSNKGSRVKSKCVQLSQRKPVTRRRRRGTGVRGHKHMQQSQKHRIRGRDPRRQSQKPWGRGPNPRQRARWSEKQIPKPSVQDAVYSGGTPGTSGSGTSGSRSRSRSRSAVEDLFSTESRLAIACLLVIYTFGRHALLDICTPYLVIFISKVVGIDATGDLSSRGIEPPCIGGDHFVRGFFNAFGIGESCGDIDRRINRLIDSEMNILLRTVIAGTGGNAEDINMDLFEGAIVLMAYTIFFKLFKSIPGALGSVRTGAGAIARTGAGVVVTGAGAIARTGAGVVRTGASVVITTLYMLLYLLGIVDIDQARNAQENFAILITKLTQLSIKDLFYCREYFTRLAGIQDRDDDALLDDDELLALLDGVLLDDDAQEAAQRLVTSPATSPPSPAAQRLVTSPPLPAAQRSATPPAAQRAATPAAGKVMKLASNMAGKLATQGNIYQHVSNNLGKAFVASAGTSGASAGTSGVKRRRSEHAPQGESSSKVNKVVPRGQSI